MCPTLQETKSDHPESVRAIGGTSQGPYAAQRFGFAPNAAQQFGFARMHLEGQQVEINIPLLDAIKQIPKYAKFLKELCIHKRKKMKGSVEVGGIVSTLTKNEDFTARAQQALLKKCQDPRIFSVPCTIGDFTLPMPCWT
ncbi:hypothetical protein CR513_41697, partial [Mucuna pruriens]